MSSKGMTFEFKYTFQEKTRMYCRRTGGAAAAFAQAANPAQRSEVPQHAGGPPLEGQGHGLQPEQDGQEWFVQRFGHLHACQQSPLAGARGNKYNNYSNNDNVNTDNNKMSIVMTTHLITSHDMH